MAETPAVGRRSGRGRAGLAKHGRGLDQPDRKARPARETAEEVEEPRPVDRERLQVVAGAAAGPDPGTASALERLAAPARQPATEDVVTLCNARDGSLPVDEAGVQSRAAQERPLRPGHEPRAVAADPEHANLADRYPDMPREGDGPAQEVVGDRGLTHDAAQAMPGALDEEAAGTATAPAEEDHVAGDVRLRLVAATPGRRCRGRCPRRRRPGAPAGRGRWRRIRRAGGRARGRPSRSTPRGWRVRRC